MQAAKNSLHQLKLQWVKTFRWVDGWACWALPARQEISIVSERKRSDLYVCFKKNNSTSSTLMLSKSKAPVSPM